MSWIKIVFINVIVLLILLILGSLALRAWDAFITKDEIYQVKDLNTNTIRATYPNYNEYERADAINIFTDYSAPKTGHSPFIEWRRNPYTGQSVNVEDQYKTRLSYNHNMNDSIWFMGGSTIWGTGAKDEETIPSYFAKTSLQNVWNLGESGYTSFQEFIQLQILLVNDLTPEVVVFYDGVNDSIYCNTNTTALPTHSREDEYRLSIEKYPKHKQMIKKLTEKAEQGYKLSDEIEHIFNKVFHFFSEPYAKRLSGFFDKRAMSTTYNKNLSSSRPLATFEKQHNYRNCDTDTKKARAAAQMTVNTWLLAYDLLSTKNIPVLFVLQPTSHIGTEFHQLDYLLDSEKQRIVDEKKSYEAQYAMIKKIWTEECLKHNACDNFLDLSVVFNGYQEPIFIDTMHISPNGNKIVANEIFNYMCKDKQFKIC